MSDSEAKTILRTYLQTGRDALLWKLDGLSEYDIRRPMTTTGTNLLGLVKHVTGVEFGYLGNTFGRPSGDPAQWQDEDADPSADMWARADESRAEIVDRYRQAWRHSDDTIDALSLDTIGTVPWWGNSNNEVTLVHALTRVLADTQRHAGHADIVRELIDGSVGMDEGNTSIGSDDPAQWAAYRGRLEEAAAQAADRDR